MNILATILGACLLLMTRPFGAGAEVTQADLVALEKRFELQLEALEQRVSSAMAASDKAVAKAEGAMDKRMEGMNEFREQLKDQAASFVTRAEAMSALVGVAGILIGIAALIARRKNGQCNYRT